MKYQNNNFTSDARISLIRMNNEVYNMALWVDKTTDCLECTSFIDAVWTVGMEQGGVAKWA
jgi:hypothetical protein